MTRHIASAYQGRHTLECTKAQGTQMVRFNTVPDVDSRDSMRIDGLLLYALGSVGASPFIIKALKWG